PHIQTDPRNLLPVAEALAARLARLDPAHAADYQGRLTAFAERLRTAIERWERRAAPLRGVGVVVHHHGWTYLEQWLGLREVGTLEPRPGVPPSTAHLAALLRRLRESPATMVIRAPFQDGRASEWLARRLHVQPVVLPFTVGGTPKAKDLFSLYEDTVDRLLAALPEAAGRQRP
ncbi:MAG: zinc ABC transporter substrate-binding protein, partial [Nitrospirae bacterium]